MQLTANQLIFSRGEELLPVYLVSGDEPLQQGEAVDLIRKKARANGFLNREIFHVAAKFDWNQVFAACLTQSLFAEKNLIEINLPSAKPGRDGSAAIEELIAEMSTDNQLIIVTGKVDKASKNTKWYKAIDKRGGIIHVWPLTDDKLTQWLKKRLQHKGMAASEQAIKYLAESVEGNLLAAAQEIEKLHVLYGPVQLSEADVFESVADNARYNVYTLTDSLLAGNVERTIQVLTGLLGEKLAAPIVIWALMRELRVLAALSLEKQTTGGTHATFKNHRVWDSKKGVYLSAVSRGTVQQWQGLIQATAHAERIIKGVERGEEWLVIEQICLAFCRPRLLDKMCLVAV
jgi:DNA polymerase-3 subunit delta